MEKQSKTLKVTCFLLYLALQFLADGISPCFYSFSISRGKYYVKKALNFAIWAFSHFFYLSKGLNFLKSLDKLRDNWWVKFLHINISSSLKIWNLPVKSVDNLCICWNISHIPAICCCYYMLIIFSVFGFSMWVLNFASLTSRQDLYLQVLISWIFFTITKNRTLKTRKIKYQ